MLMYGKHHTQHQPDLNYLCVCGCVCVDLISTIQVKSNLNTLTTTNKVCFTSYIWNILEGKLNQKHCSWRLWLWLVTVVEVVSTRKCTFTHLSEGKCVLMQTHKDTWIQLTNKTIPTTHKTNRFPDTCSAIMKLALDHRRGFDAWMAICLHTICTHPFQCHTILDFWMPMQKNLLWELYKKI